MLCNRLMHESGLAAYALCTSISCLRVSASLSRADLFNGAWRTRHELTAVSTQVCLINWSRRPARRASRTRIARALFSSPDAVLCSCTEHRAQCLWFGCRRGATRRGAARHAARDGTSRAHRMRPVSASSLINTDMSVSFVRLTRSMGAPAFCALRTSPFAFY